MVIADAESPGPLRKRPRLSLKVLKGPSGKETTGSTRSGTEGDSKEEPTEAKSVCNVVKCNDDVKCDEAKMVQEVSLFEDNSASDSIQEAKQVPAVTSLVNLGNTCFLNSILQVLRYTPGFLNRLEDLYQQIVQTEKLKKQVQAEKEDPGSSDNNDTVQTIELVKHLFRLYKNMERQEDRHPDIATADVMSMALRPDRILSVVREINPMFEGYLQHDAQELLRCILCYLQDAEKEIHKIKSSLPPRVFPQSSGPINPIMQRFLSAGKNTSMQSKDLQQKIMSEGVSTNQNGDNPKRKNMKCASSVNVYHKPDILDQIEQNEAVKSKVTDSSNNSDPNMRSEVNGESSPLAQVMDEKKSCGRKTRGSSSRNQTKSQGQTVKCEGQQETVKKKSGRLLDKNSIDNPHDGDKSDEIDGTVSSNAVLCRGTDKEEESKKKTRATRVKRSNGNESTFENKENDSETKTGNLKQPGILHMLQSQGRCKRLGMRGATLMKNTQNNVTGNTNKSKCPGSRDTSEECDINNSSSSDRSMKNGALKTESPEVDLSNSPRHPFVKLEKCDHVCDSPKKSVNADYATMKLSPFKTKSESPANKLTSPKKSLLISNNGVGCARHKLDFSCDNGDVNNGSVAKQKAAYSPVRSPHKSVSITPTKRGKITPKKNRQDIVEKLFMGSMMLRTKCLECESSRERIEEFHDISVPVRKKTAEDSDEEDDDTDDDGDSCLKKLMEAFTEVERLRDDNKYFCDKCIRYVEAERSLHYEVLPDVLSLHLKRFSSTSGIYGYVSKINDHVSIPLSLPCLRYKCPSPCSRPDHRYRLYALVTHAGVTLSSGHYLTYVRVSSATIATENGRTSGLQTLSSPKEQYSSTTNFTMVPKEKYSNHWLECDDETIRVYSEDKFCSLLKGQDGALLGTPYVLFYHRVTQGWQY